jgi:hypothetical protein
MVIDFPVYTERLVFADSPVYADTLNRALKTVVTLSGLDPADAFPGFALRPTVDASANQYYRATGADQEAEWHTLVAADVTDLATAATEITRVGTVTTGVWHGTSIDTAYTDAKIKTVTGTTGKITVGGTATDPTFTIASDYIGQASITTVGTIVSGIWTGASIGTAYTDAKVVSISGVTNRTTISGTATVPIVDIAATYAGQSSIVTLGTVSTGVWQGSSIATTYTDAKIVSVTGTAQRITVGGTATAPTFTIAADYPGQTSIITVGTVSTGTWQGTAIGTAYTVAQLVTLTGTSNRIDIGGTATDPTVNISTLYAGQNTIVTLGTVTTGTWTASSIATTYTDAKLKTATGTANRLTVGGTATDPIFDISAAYVGQATITTLGTVATGTWSATTIATTVGGTGLTSYAKGDLLYSSATNVLAKLAGNTTTQAQFLLQTGDGAASAAPVWHTLVAGDITDLSSASTGITKVGTVTTGIWQAGVVGSTYGGTGVNNGSSTITLGGSLTFSGAFATTFTVTAGTSVTLPTTGTLVNTAVTALTALASVGTITSGTWQGTAVAPGFGGTGIASYTIGDIVYASGTTTLSKLGIGTANQVLMTNAGATAPAWTSVLSGLTSVAATTVSGTTATFTNLGGTLSTAAQPNITSVGVLVSPHMTGAVVDSGGLTVTAGGMTVTAGGLTVSASGITVTGNSTITGTLGGITTLSTSSTINGQTISSVANLTGSLTVASGFTVTAGGATITAGGLTVTAGGLTVSASGITVTGNSTITGTLTALTGITSSGTASFATITSSATITAGTGLTVSAGGATITGNSTNTGTWHVTGAATYDSTIAVGGNITVTKAGAVETHVTAIVTGGGQADFFAGATYAGVGSFSNVPFIFYANSTEVFRFTNATTMTMLAGTTLATQTITASTAITTGAGVKINLDGGSGAVYVVNNSANRISFGASSAEVMRIDGGVGLTVTGTITSNSALSAVTLNASGDASALSRIMDLTDTNASAGTDGLARFFRSGSQVGGITTTLSVTAFNTSSDMRLKIDRGIASGLEFLRGVVVHDFDWKVDGTPDRGVFAQEAYKVPGVNPHAIRVGTTLSDPWAVDYSKFVPDLIVGWQDHEAKITALDHRIQMLEVTA